MKRLKRMVSKNSPLKNKEYLEITYKEAKTNKGNYPEKLATFLLENYFHKTGRILDIGCGNGDFLKAFSKLGFDVVGVDISPDTIERLGDDFDVRVIDLESGENIFNQEFDFVFSKSVIEHMREPTTLFDFALNSLKKDGVAVIMCPSWEHTYHGPFYIDHTHVTPFTRPSLEETFVLSGFDKAKVEYFHQLPFVWNSKLFKVLPKLISFLPIPYSPWNRVPWTTNNPLNKIVRFSKEVMLLGTAIKR